MKNLFHILFFLSLFIVTASPQDRIHSGVMPEELTAKRIMELLQSNAGDLQRLHDREPFLLKSKSSNWQTALKNLQREFYEEEGFDTRNTRTIINKTLLGNGFLLVEVIWEEWDGSAWVNLSRRSYTYDGNNNLTVEIGQSWNGSAWVNVLKQSYAYDGNNNEIEYLRQNWDSSAWVNDRRWSYTYDANNNQTEEIYQNWSGSAWVNSYRFSYTYDGNNNLIETLMQGWVASAWLDYSKNSYTYNGNNDLTEEIYQTWDGSAWVNVSRLAYTYDASNNEIEYLRQNGAGSGWVNFSKWSYTYDGNNNLIEELYQTWENSAWENDKKYTYTYDGNYEWPYTYNGINNLTEYLYQTWNGSAWVNVDKFMYSYIPTGVEHFEGEVSTYSLSNNYPNPFNPVTTIQYSIPQRSSVTLKVYDILGNEIALLVNEEKDRGVYSLNFDASHLASGLYLYRLQASGFIETKKMILLR